MCRTHNNWYSLKYIDARETAIRKALADQGRVPKTPQSTPRHVDMGQGEKARSHSQFSLRNQPKYISYQKYTIPI